MNFTYRARQTTQKRRRALAASKNDHNEHPGEFQTCMFWRAVAIAFGDTRMPCAYISRTPALCPNLLFRRHYSPDVPPALQHHVARSPTAAPGEGRAAEGRAVCGRPRAQRQRAGPGGPQPLPGDPQDHRRMDGYEARRGQQEVQRRLPQPVRLACWFFLALVRCSSCPWQVFTSHDESIGDRCTPAFDSTGQLNTLSSSSLPY